MLCYVIVHHTYNRTLLQQQGLAFYCFTRLFEPSELSGTAVLFILCQQPCHLMHIGVLACVADSGLLLLVLLLVLSCRALRLMPWPPCCRPLLACTA